MRSTSPSPRRGRKGFTAVRAALLRWYDRHRRDLPWRRTQDPYALWVSEVMLQQTQVSVVLPYWEGFLRRFPDVASLARAPLDDVLAAWRGLGYYARARNLQRAARCLVEEHGGRLPANVEGLRSLPGFGRYTVGAVASIAFGLPVPVVDGNVARVLSRLFAIDGIPGSPSRERTLWRLAEGMVKGDRPGDWNQALMELGATVCRPERPSCLLCPVQQHCQAQAGGLTDSIPPARPRATRRKLHLAVAVVRRGETVLLVRRPGTGLFGGLWELPSLECEPGMELATLTARWSTAPRRLGTVRRMLTHRDLSLAVFELEPDSVSADGGRWVNAEQARSMGVSAAMQAVLTLAFGKSIGRRASTRH